MSKQNSSSLVSKLMKRNLREHVPRTLLFVIIVALLSGTIVALSILDTSAYHNIQSFYLQQHGSKGHIRIDGLTNAEVQKLKDSEEVEGVGTSIYIGDVIDSELQGEQLELRCADEIYADYTFSEPKQGRMPKEKEEIALDTGILDKFGIDHSIGNRITLSWKENEQIIQKTFKIVGIWEGSKVAPNHMAWVSSAILPQNLEARSDSELLIKKYDPEKIEDILSSIGIKNKDYHVNEVYNEEINWSILSDTLAYKVGGGAVLICAFFILHSVLYIAFTTDRKLYGRMKVLGATSKQIRKAVLYQSSLLGIPGIVMGLLIGTASAKLISKVIFSNLMITPKVYFVYWNFILSICLVYAVVMIAAFGPARTAGKVNPSDLLSEEDNIYFNSKTERRLPGLPVIFQMALYNIGRNKKKNLLVIFLLTLGTLTLGSVYVIQKSFDINIYMKEIALGDFTISERTLVNTWGEYNPNGDTISSDVIKTVKNLPEVYETGTLYSKDISLDLPDKVYNNIIQYYEQNDGEILEYMKQSIGWTEGYHKTKENHICPTTVFGVDGIVSDKLMENSRLLEGEVNKEKFLSGDYVLAQGLEGIDPLFEQPTYSVGDKVNINGKEYEVMAIISAPYPVIEGKVSPGYEFNLQFFMPNSQFYQLFPDSAIRRYTFNVHDEDKQEVQKFLEDYTEKYNIPLISEKSIEKEYHEETNSSMVVAKIISIMFLIIGIINMVNATITSVNLRKKEFAMMQSIGMTKKQLRILLLFESIGLITITLLISYFLNILVINIGVKGYLQTQWTATYNFTITPLLLVSPILIIIAVVVPIVCFNHLQKRELMDQLDNSLE